MVEDIARLIRESVSDDKLREIIEQAHMAGQHDAGVDAGYSNARAYCNKIFGACLRNLTQGELERR